MGKGTKIVVTQRDIDRGLEKSSGHCVVAVALARAIPDATRIEVDLQTIRYTSEGQRFEHLTPWVVQGYVIAFDAGDPIEPFDFVLRDPVRVRRRKMSEVGKARARVRNAGRRRDVKAPNVTRDAAADALVAAGGGPVAPTDSAEDGSPLPRPSPRTYNNGRPGQWRTGRRTYGMRVLRYNQTYEAAMEGREEEANL